MNSKPNTYLLIDYSGSTGGEAAYWNYASKLISENPDATYVIWDTEAQIISRSAVQKIADKRQGNGGTQPQCFIKLIPEKSNLILLTDGQISTSDVDKCEKILNGRMFTKVDVHFYKTSGEVNLSVSTPLTRKTKYRMYLDGKILAEGSSIEAIDLNPYFNNPEKFVDESDNLLKQIIMQNLGKTNTSLRDELLKLQKNMLNYIATSNSSDNKFGNLRELLSDGQYDDSIKLMKEVISKGDTSLGKQIEKIIQEMIAQCSGSNNFSLNILEPGRLTRATVLDKITVEEIPKTEHYSAFECPIFFEHDIPLCLIKTGPPVFFDVEKNYLDNIMTNPFLVLNDSNLAERVKNRIDHLIGFDAGKSLFANANVKSPMSRELISSALVLGNDTTHSTATNFALADIFFGKKLVGQSELWLSVLYFIIKQITYLSEDIQFMKVLESNLIYRMKSCNTNITLSGLPIEPLLKCPMDLAIWYCVASPLIVSNKSETDDARNRLRSFGSSVRYLLELVELLGYPYNKSWTTYQLSLYRVFAWMMNEEKNCTQWRKLIRSQYQNSMTLEDGKTLIILDGPALNKPSLPSNCEGVPIVDLRDLMNLVSQNRTTNSVMIPIDFNERKCMKLKYEVNYGYPEIVEDVPVKISPRTMRPYVIDLKLRKHWTICSEKIYGPLDKQISNDNYFIRYVDEYHCYPSKREFYLYIESKQANRLGNPVSTLPKMIAVFIDSLFQDYEEVLGVNFNKVPSSKFKELASNSRKEDIRGLLDGSL